MKLNQLVEEWLYSYHKDNIKTQSLMRYECAYKNYILNDKLGNQHQKDHPRDMQSLSTKKEVEKSSYKSNMSEITSTSYYILRSFSYAVDFGLLKENPCDKNKTDVYQEPKEGSSIHGPRTIED